MGYASKRNYKINKRLRTFIDNNDKRPSKIADKAGIRRDTFSHILSCRRSIYAEELVPICKAANCPLSYLLEIDNGGSKEDVHM